jgi:hypothetical protein
MGKRSFAPDCHVLGGDTEATITVHPGASLPTQKRVYAAGDSMRRGDAIAERAFRLVESTEGCAASYWAS